MIDPHPASGGGSISSWAGDRGSVTGDRPWSSGWASEHACCQRRPPVDPYRRFIMPRQQWASHDVCRLAARGLVAAPDATAGRAQQRAGGWRRQPAPPCRLRPRLDGSRGCAAGGAALQLQWCLGCRPPCRCTPGPAGTRIATLQQPVGAAAAAATAADTGHRPAGAKAHGGPRKRHTGATADGDYAARASAAGQLPGGGSCCSSRQRSSTSAPWGGHCLHGKWQHAAAASDSQLCPSAAPGGTCAAAPAAVPVR
jgi:hypothetical protein